jgi:hypothetical protein
LKAIRAPTIVSSNSSGLAIPVIVLVVMAPPSAKQDVAHAPLAAIRK